MLLLLRPQPVASQWALIPVVFQRVGGGRRFSCLEPRQIGRGFVSPAANEMPARTAGERLNNLNQIIRKYPPIPNYRVSRSLINSAA
jgi:hypothetical protein